MSRLYRLEGIVLRRRPLGEVDELVTLLSPSRGKVDAAARASRKPGSRMVGRLEPFTWLHLMLARGRTLDRIAQADVRRAWPGLRKDLDRLVWGSYLLELFSNCVPHGWEADEAEARPFFFLLVEALEALEGGAAGDRLCRWAELRLMGHLGYAPELDRCVGCAAALPVSKGGWFVPSAGGVCCAGCAPGSWHRRLLSPAALASLRHLRDCRLQGALGLHLEPEAAEEVDGALRAHLLEHWPGHLRSLGVLRRLATGPSGVG